jgi:hypothetical protein
MHNLFLDFEIYGTNSNVNIIPGRHIIWLRFGCRGCGINVRCVVFCLLVVDRKIMSFKPYLSVVIRVGGEMTSDVLFYSSRESIVAYLNRYTSQL